MSEARTAEKKMSDACNPVRVQILIPNGDEVCTLLLEETTSIGDVKKFVRLSKKAYLLPAPRFMVCFQANDSSGDTIDDTRTLEQLRPDVWGDGQTPQIRLHMGSRPMRVLFMHEGSDPNRRDVVAILKALNEDGAGAESLNSIPAAKERCLRAVGAYGKSPGDSPSLPASSVDCIQQSTVAMQLSFFWHTEVDEVDCMERFAKEASSFDVIVVGESDPDVDDQYGESRSHCRMLDSLRRHVLHKKLQGGWVILQGKAGTNDPRKAHICGYLPYLGPIVPSQYSLSTYDKFLSEKDPAIAKEHWAFPARPLSPENPDFERLFPGIDVASIADELYGDFNCWSCESVPLSMAFFDLKTGYGAPVISRVGILHDEEMRKREPAIRLAEEFDAASGTADDLDVCCKIDPYTRVTCFSVTANRAYPVAHPGFGPDNPDAEMIDRKKFETPFARVIAAHIQAAYREMEFEKVEELLLTWFPIGSSVEIHSIQSQPALNGQRGEIEAKAEKAGRLGVRLQGATKALSLSIENLIRATDSTPAIAKAKPVPSSSPASSSSCSSVATEAKKTQILPEVMLSAEKALDLDNGY
mmetsp:Transcript_19403/g.48584  ORF Transcript_19403/g.48584 Transcript_19403/m.48584 type:complete len:584 (+) Transcript_19403:45-1796(+)